MVNCHLALNSLKIRLMAKRKGRRSSPSIISDFLGIRSPDFDLILRRHVHFVTLDHAIGLGKLGHVR